MKREKNVSYILAIIFYIIFGAILGLSSAKRLSIVPLLSLIVFSTIFHIIIHEAGHLAFGLLSGYKYSSFRVFSFAWVRQGNKIRLKRYSVPGTLGQCILSPPDLVDGKMPYILYNLGGVIVNAFFSVVFAAMAFMLRSSPEFSACFTVFSAFGAVLALSNGIPQRVNGVGNDGMNIFDAAKNPRAVGAMWIQLKLNELLLDGMRLRDMPTEWFGLPPEEDMKSGLISSLGVFYAERLIDEHRFHDAAPLIDRLLSVESEIAVIHRQLLTCQRLFCAIVIERNFELAVRLYDKAFKKFLNAMPKSLTVIRTKYVIALHMENAPSKAAELWKRFEKCSKKFPYSGEIISEYELMKIAENAFLQHTGARQ